jgi:hypothetical protein
MHAKRPRAERVRRWPLQFRHAGKRKFGGTARPRPSLPQLSASRNPLSRDAPRSHLHRPTRPRWPGSRPSRCR